MTASAALVTLTFPVGKRTCTLTIGAAGQCVAEWSPTEPTRLDAAEWLQYREGRAQAVAELSRKLGGNVLVVDL